MYKKVVLAYDGSACSEMALQEAARVVAGEIPGATALLVLAVADTALRPLLGHGHDTAETAAAAVAKTQKLLEQAGQRLATQGIQADCLLVDLTENRGGRIAQVILDEAVEAGADLIVLGTHGRRGFQRFLLGSVAETVARLAPVPVLLVRASPVSAFGCLNPAEIYGQWPENERIVPEA
jgi:nucleotide-binding universal stress UspA family protein